MGKHGKTMERDEYQAAGFASFQRDCIELGRWRKADQRDAWGAYRAYVETEHRKGRPFIHIGRRAFTLLMREAGHEEARAGGRRIWRHISLTPAALSAGREWLAADTQRRGADSISDVAAWWGARVVLDAFGAQEPSRTPAQEVTASLTQWLGRELTMSDRLELVDLMDTVGVERDREAGMVIGMSLREE